MAGGPPLSESLRQNWVLVAIVIALVGSAGYFALKGGGEPPDTDGPSEVARSRDEPATRSSAIAPRPRLTPQEEALKTIEEHRAQIIADPESGDVPALYNAMGNLYRQKLVDYEKAAECYEMILATNPEWDHIRQVYMQLATCYERSGQKEKALGVYRDIMEAFPEDSQEYQIARDALYD